MQKGLVSVITPCYNTGKHIHRLLDSVLSQDYPQISMLVVDDGSTDNSREVIDSYIPRFAQKGYSLEYRYQENSGQSVAINNALKWVDGEYLVWPDSDDWYTEPDAISMMVKECAKSKNIGLVRCLFRVYDPSLKLMQELQVSPEILDEEQFEACLLRRKDYYYAPGEYMLRMDVLDEVLPERDIFTAKMAGQNGQIMLPVLYRRKCVTISRHMYALLWRPDSHTKGQTSYAKSREVIQGYIGQLVSTLDKMRQLNVNSREAYKDEVRKEYLPELFVLAVAAGQKADAVMAKKELQSLNAYSVGLEWKIRFFFCHFNWFQRIVKFIGRKISR